MSKIFVSSPNTADAYVKALIHLGNEVVLSKDCNKEIPLLDGLLLTGGADVNPAYYGETVDGAVGIDEERDAYEKKVFETYLQAGKPILGICRGHQLINALMGGKLIQDLHTGMCHVPQGGKVTVHTVRTEEGSIVNTLLGDAFYVNSYHHEAVKVPGKGMKVTAISEKDGVIEATEHESLPILSVQWHPERCVLEELIEGVPDNMPLFVYFTDLCK